MVLKEDADQSAQNSQLFMLRLWLEDLGSGKTDWRGKVQHVNSGEARYFRDWLTLEAFVEGLIRRYNEDESSTGQDDENDRVSPEM